MIRSTVDWNLKTLETTRDIFSFDLFPCSLQSYILEAATVKLVGILNETSTELYIHEKKGNIIMVTILQGN